MFKEIKILNAAGINALGMHDETLVSLNIDFDKKIICISSERLESDDENYYILELKFTETEHLNIPFVEMKNFSDLEIFSVTAQKILVKKIL